MKKTLSPTALIIVLLSLLLLFVSCKDQLVSETYYSFTNGSLDKSNYWTLNSDNTWTDSDGMAGTYDLNGTSITIYCFGTEFYTGTLENGKLSFGDLVYYLEDKAPTQSPDLTDSTQKNEHESNNNGDSSGENTAPTSHTHSYGVWTTTTPSTCISEGTQTRSCSCGDIQTQSIAVTEHNYVDYTCTVCGDISCIVIKTPDDLKKLDNSTETFMLANDIDLAGIDWTPIKSFSGTLIGNGFTIKNLTINASEKWVGLFADLRGTVQNLSIENANVTVTGNYKCIGILCGTLEGKGQISDITVYGNVTALNSTSVGGIVGYVAKQGDYTLKNLESHTNVTAENSVGGIAGYFGDNYDTSSNDVTSTISTLKNSGTIVGEQYVGGIIGNIYCQNSSVSQTIKIFDVQNTGNVSGKSNVGGIVGHASSNNWKQSVIENSVCKANIEAECYVGCIAGSLENITVNNCSNEGSTLTATKYYSQDGIKYAMVGGFVGYGYLVNNCTNKVTINYSSNGRYVGGIIGYIPSRGSANMSNLHNSADITGYEYVGGIIGTWDSEATSSNDTLNLSSFSNSGKISSTKNYAGGIIGFLYSGDTSSYSSTVSISDFSNTGDVIGKQYVGGIIGYGESDNTKSYIIGCSNKSSIQAEAYVGCIAGKLVYISIDDCVNEDSKLTVTRYAISDSIKYAFAGGFVGYGYGASNCTNKVSINYTAGGECVGGIMGFTGGVGCFAGQKLTFDNLINDAAITGTDYVGGIIGAVSLVCDDWYYTNTYNFIEMKNTGSITGTGKYTGGIFGYVYINTDGGNSWVYITDPMNSGNITGNDYVGGILGYLDKNTNSSFHGDANQSAIIDPVSTGVVIGKTNYGDIYGSCLIPVQ